MNFALFGCPFCFRFFAGRIVCGIFIFAPIASAWLHWLREQYSDDGEVVDGVLLHEVRTYPRRLGR